MNLRVATSVAIDLYGMIDVRLNTNKDKDALFKDWTVTRG